MWNERRMTSGPGQTKAGAASCPLDAIGEDRPLSLSAHSCEHRRARRPPASSNPFGASPPFRRGCHPPPERRARVPTRNDEPSTSNARTNRNRSRRAQTRAEATGSRTVEERSSRRPYPGRTPSTYGWRYASRDRTHRSARDWQRYVVGKVRLSPRTAKDPGAGAGGSRDHQGRGSPCREAPAISDLECWRDPTEREVRMSLSVGSHAYPTAARLDMEDLGCTNMCTKCDNRSTSPRAD